MATRLGPTLGPRGSGSPAGAPRPGPTVGYAWPTTAAALNTAMGGRGTWASAWQCDEASGSLADAFSSITLTAEATPLYRETGAFTGDFAAGFDSGSADRFAAASTATYDLSAATSIGLYVCFRATTTIERYFAGKTGAGRWAMLITATSGITAQIADGVTLGESNIATSHVGNGYHDALMVVDRTGQRVQLFTDLGTGTAIDITAINSLSNANPFFLGADVASTIFGMSIAFAAVATGDIVNLRAGGAAAIASIRAYTGRA